MNQVGTAIGGIMGMVVIIFGFVLTILVILTPIFIYNINCRLKELLEVQKQSWKLMKEFLDRMG